MIPMGTRETYLLPCFRKLELTMGYNFSHDQTSWINRMLTLPLPTEHLSRHSRIQKSEDIYASSRILGFEVDESPSLIEAVNW
jgi:hypothetical protein